MRTVSYSMFIRHVGELAGVVETVNYSDAVQNIILLALIPQLYCGVNHCLSLSFLRYAYVNVYS